jgi:flagellar hook-associated protein 1
MNLSSALDLAQASLSNASYRTAAISQNISNAKTEGYARRVANYVSGQFGQGPSVSIERVAANAVRDAALDANASAQANQSLVDGYVQLSATVGDPALGTSVGALVGALADALQSAAAQPSSAVLAGAAIRNAGALAAKLNSASAAVQTVRQQADSDLAASVGRINSLLAEFKTANDAVAQGAAAGQKALDAKDTRDAIVASLSQEIGVVARPQSDGGLALYADSGVTLFDRVPRTVKFTASGTLPPGAAGQPVVIDGVDATSPVSPMPVQSGRIAGLIALRDKASVTYQAQLDETARGLVSAFAEGGQGAPDAPGLFTYSGAPAMPGNALQPGLAAQIRVNPNADPAQGGDAARLRDGGISFPGNPAYVYNTANDAGFSQRLQDLADSLQAKRGFDAAAGLNASQSIESYAVASSASLEQGRQDASNRADQTSALRDRAQQALGNATGVNIDDESARMLEVEQSYQASAKLISAINSMFSTLLQAMVPA